MKASTSFFRIDPSKLADGCLRTACATIFLLLMLPAVTQAQDFTYTTNNGAITITGYNGSGGTVTIPDTINGLLVTRIGSRAFFWSANATSVAIPNTITSIEFDAFWCPSLSEITVDVLNSVYSSVDGVLFNNNQSTLIQYPQARAGSYSIPSATASIGDWAFFGSGKLTSVTIPNSVTGIGRLAFAGCTNLMAITVDAVNSNYSSLDGVLFNKKSQTTLIQYPGGKAGSYVIPNSVTSIVEGAFYSSTSLISVMIPDSVNSIGTGAFSGCSNMTNLTLNGNVINIGAGAFEKCYKLSSVTIPASVTTIRNNVFSHCTGLSSVIIGESVTNIGVLAFYGCTNLASVRIPKSVTGLESGAFQDCTSLTGVYFVGDAPRVDQFAFYNSAVYWVYYLPGTTGWGPWIGDVWTKLWDAEAQTGDASFGIHTNQFGYSEFGFNITGSSGLVVVVEACTNLARPSWSVVATNAVGWSYFSDPDWTNYPARYYRIRSN